MEKEKNNNKGLVESIAKQMPNGQKITAEQLLGLNRHERRRIGKIIGKRIPGVHIPIAKKK